MKCRRFLSLLLAAVMCLSLLLGQALAAESSSAMGFDRSKTYAEGWFRDVKSTDWFAENVKIAYEYGLLQGKTADTFAPRGTVTLAETVAVAARIHASAAGQAEPFVQEEPWYQVYVDYALANDILTEALTDYTRPATRLEFACILEKASPASALAAVNTVEDGCIPDLEADAAVYRLYRAGILVGSDEKGTFYPDSNIQRSEMATILARLLDPAQRKLLTLKAPSNGNAGAVEPVVPAQPSTPEEDGSKADTVLTEPFDLANPDAFASGDIQYSSEQILVKFRPGFTGMISGALKAAGVTALEKLMSVSSGEWYIAFVTGEIQEVMKAVRALPEVLLAEYDYVYESSAIVDSDTVYDAVSGNARVREQWALRSCGLQNAWKWMAKKTGSFGGDASVIVAVIDTGVDYTHEDLKSNIWVNQGEIPGNGIDDDGNGYVDDIYGVNLETGSGSGMDDNGHGTHVAGIIAGVNNNLGVVGAAPGVRIMPIKAGMASGYFNQSQIAKAILYAYENGAQVINMSFGGSASTIAVQDALETAYTRCVLVASAGNDGKPNEGGSPCYPAALPYVLGVMSVDSTGTEASYTNWDVTAFNSVEYEVYAPGTGILSTIPGNKYAAWSGTSMAAPYVSAVAALLRSAYPDLETYSTKFIYGQISATSGQNAVCCAPEVHGAHNLPPIVDAYKALTVMPKPDVNVSDYLLFDQSKYSDANNGDGVIDAGETVALGFTLRNRWGKSADTLVTVSTNSPYVTIANPTVNYGSVGTYSTRDCGAVKDGEVILGWEDPFLLTFSKDCPNDYIVALNVSVSCSNGLDEDDVADYTSEATVELRVRRGVILPDIIREDMTLTKDNYYIIPNATEIKPDVTVTVEAGTQIQFWSDDPDDAYADTAITYLVVRGRLLCEGAEDERIRIFPSDLMDNYRVQIYEKDDGYVSLKYTDVVNGYFFEDVGGVYTEDGPYGDSGITYAYGCEFSKNYDQQLSYRILNSGKIDTLSRESMYNIELAVNCVFYRLGSSDTSNNDYVRASCYNCLFVDDAVQLLRKYNAKKYSYEGCVFYGNNSCIATDYSTTSAYTASAVDGDLTISSVRYHSEASTTYLAVEGIGQFPKAARRFAQYLGGDLACFETEEEQEWLTEDLGISGWYLCGLYQNPETGRREWITDPQQGEDIPVTFEMPTQSSGYCYFNPVEKTFSSSYYSIREGVLIEIPDTAADTWTTEKVLAQWDAFCTEGLNTSFYHNAILNRFTDADVEHWLRIQAPTGNSDNVYGLGGNYWGTAGLSEAAKTLLIDKQIVDNRDYKTLARLNEGTVLEEVPEDVWPCIARVGLINADGKTVTTVGNEPVTFFVEFNRDMDTNIPLSVRFGSSYPYGDYEVEGEYVTARRWEGSKTLNTLIESGNQYWSVSNGRSAEGH